MKGDHYLGDSPSAYVMPAIIALYAIGGIATYAAYKNAGIIGKLVYVMFFPFHWGAATFFSAVAKDHRYISVPLIAIVGGIVVLVSAQKEEGGWMCPTLIFVPVLVAAFNSSGKWGEKKKFFED